MSPSILSQGRVFLVCLGLLTSAFAAQGQITIDEVYSNFDGSVQFIVLKRSGDPLPSLAGRTLVATDGVTTNRYTFPGDVQADRNHPQVLLTTQRFANLGKITPDYVLPDNFLLLPNASVVLDDAKLDYVGNRLPADGWHALYRDSLSGSNHVFVAAAVNSRGDVYSLRRDPTVTGLWWNPAQPGWALAVEAQADATLAVWATHGADGSPTWFVAIGDPVVPPCFVDEFGFFDCSDLPSGSFTARLYAMTGPSSNAAFYDPSRLAATDVGSIEIAFPTTGACVEAHELDRPCPTEGSLHFVIGDASGQRSLSQAVFGDPVRQCFLSPAVVSGPTNYQGLWWNPSESGWALELNHQGDVIFAVWFTYDEAGRAVWLSFTASRTADDIYSGTLYRSTGTPFSSTPDPSVVTNTALGTASLAFTDVGHATFTYIVNGASGTKAVQREQLANAAPICD